MVTLPEHRLAGNPLSAAALLFTETVTVMGLGFSPEEWEDPSDPPFDALPPDVFSPEGLS